MRITKVFWYWESVETMRSCEERRQVPWTFHRAIRMFIVEWKRLYFWFCRSSFDGSHVAIEMRCPHFQSTRGWCKCCRRICCRHGEVGWSCYYCVGCCRSDCYCFYFLCRYCYLLLLLLLLLLLEVGVTLLSVRLTGAG
jgi:hypothetical protein